MCADACPSGAISMVPVRLPAQQPKKEAVVNALNALAYSKTSREAGYMLPQSGNANRLLRALLENPAYADIPADVVGELLNRLPSNEAEAESPLQP